jgi:DNA-binding FadR family transcriptional regulator
MHGAARLTPGKMLCQQSVNWSDQKAGIELYPSGLGGSVPLETIEHRRLYRQVADQLRALIEEGEFAPGARLPSERDLADQLGISRPTVREALIALEVEGKVRIRVGSGVYVVETPEARPVQIQPVQAEGPFEVLHARQLIEATVAGEAARQASPEDIAALGAILAGMAKAEHPGPALMRLDREFHVTIAGVLGNGFLARVVGELHDQRINPVFHQLASYFETRESWMQALAEHRAILDCIAARDADGAGLAMRRHLIASQDRFSQSFGDTAQPRAKSGRGGRAAGRTDGAPRPSQAKPGQAKLRQSKIK